MFSKSYIKIILARRETYQRALEAFHSIVITRNDWYCNCENHKRFRNCNERTLFRLFCHDTSLFTKQEIDTIDTLQGSLKRRINRNKEVDKAFDNKITISQPSAEDPFFCVIRPDDRNILKFCITFNGLSHLPWLCLWTNPDFRQDNFVWRATFL